MGPLWTFIYPYLLNKDDKTEEGKSYAGKVD